jgi:molecular chaperone DnaJ
MHLVHRPPALGRYGEPRAAGSRLAASVAPSRTSHAHLPRARVCTLAALVAAAPTTRPRARPPPPPPRRRRRRRPVVAAASASRQRDLYEVLGVPPTATDADIKRAYRQRALKLHPDVNKAPDAQARFMEAKSAFAALSDPEQRRAYDRRRRFFGGGEGGGGAGGGPGGFGGFGGSGGAGARPQQPRPQQPPEDFYGLSDFFRDLEREADGWRERRQERQRGRQQGASSASSASASASASAEPASLWEELAAIGEELVDYLEETLGIEEEEEEVGGSKGGGGGGGNGGSSSSSSNGASRGPVDDFEAWKRRYDPSNPSAGANGSKAGGGGAAAGAGAPSSSSSAKAPPPPPPPPKAKPMSSADEIEDMLAALKRKVGRDK